MFVGAQCSDGTGSILYNQLRHDAELDGFDRRFGMQRHRLYGLSERKIDRYDHEPDIQRHRAVGVDAVQFLGCGERLGWSVCTEYGD
jgi:hypothetical protein